MPETSFINQNVPDNTLDNNTKQQLQGESGRGKRVGKWIAVFLFMIAIVGFGVWFIFGRNQEIGQPKVRLELEGPASLPSNGETSARIVVANDDKLALKDLQLELVYPSGLAYISSVPEASGLSGSSFALPELVGGQNVSVLLKLRIQANVGDVKQLKVKLRYKTTESSAVFAVEESREWSIKVSGFELKLTGPGEVGNGELISYKVGYSNSSDTVLNNARLSVQLPESFKIGKTEPPANLGDSSWLIPRLDPGQSASVSLFGNFEGAALGRQEVLRAVFSILDKDGSYVVQANSNFTTLIKDQPISTSQELQTSTKVVANPGDKISYIIKYQNNSTSPVKNVRVVFKAESKSVNWSDVRAEEAQINSGSVTWSPASTNQLSILRPGEKGQFLAELPILTPPAKDSSQNLAIISSITILSDEYRTPIRGNDLEVRIATKSQVAGKLEYVSGANPPKVGQETVYKATLTASNTSNMLSGTKVTARLPLGSGSLTGGNLPKNLNLDTSGARLSWEIGNLQAYAGSFSPVASVSFMIKLVPSSSQFAKEVVLVTDINLTATDSFTGHALSLKGIEITTDNAFNGSGRGRVVE